MSTFDIRIEPAVEITKLLFAESRDGNTNVAHFVDKFVHKANSIRIHDSGEFVVVSSVEHARNLIKTLEKAIELGWVK